MTRTTSFPSGAKARKVALQMLAGGLAGGFGMFGLLTLIDADKAFLAADGRVLALGTALVYLLMGLLVGLGTLAPAFGARALNVEDEGDIREQRTALLVGGVSAVAIALFLGALALVRDDAGNGVLTRGSATVIAAVAAIVLVVVGIRFRKVGDELMRQVSREANGWTIGLLLLVAGGNAAGAVLGYTDPLAPLEFLAAFFALFLAATFIAAGRRGLLAPR